MKNRKSSSSDSVKSDKSRVSAHRAHARTLNKELQDKLREFEQQKISHREEMEKLKRELEHMKITMEQNKNTEFENLEVRHQEVDEVSQPENLQENQGISQSGVALDQQQISQVGDMFSQSGEPQTQTLTQ